MMSGLGSIRKGFHCFVLVLTLFGSGCSSFSDKNQYPRPQDTIAVETGDDENFIYEKDSFTAHGFDTEKTEYNYSASDVIETAYFEFDRAYVNRLEEEKILSISKMFLRDPSLRILIVGNCDKFGKDSYNYKLGERRANAVKDILIMQGISADRIVTASLGATRAHKHILSKADGALDRRCDIVVRKKTRK